jgi:beta-glucanase (GH16 family)
LDIRAAVHQQAIKRGMIMSAFTRVFIQPFIMLFTLILSISAAPPSGRSWTMTFNDEFSGTTLDLAKWDTIDVCCGHTDHDEYYRGANCIVNGGILTEVFKQESYGGKGHTSGSVTARTFRQQYGYYEINAKFQKGNGIWPAFWLDGSGTNAWEMDVMEWLGYQQSILHYNFHNWNGGHTSTGKSFDAGMDLSAAYHTYAMEWKTNNDLAFYFDDALVAQITGFAIGQNIQALPMCANLQGVNAGQWGPSMDNTTPMPFYYYIDWIRVYQEGGTGNRQAQKLPAVSQYLRVLSDKLIVVAQGESFVTITNSRGQTVLTSSIKKQGDVLLTGLAHGAYQASVRTIYGLQTLSFAK